MFSNNGKSVGSYVFSHERYIKNASIKEINHKKHFYGDCGTNENVLSMLEGKWSCVINNIVETQQVPRDEENYTYLLMFLLVSALRTPSVSNDFEKAMTKLVKIISEMYSKHGKQRNEPQVEFKGTPSMFLKSAIGMTPILLDLYPLLIINKTQNNFITSDSPVAFYNQLFVAKNCKTPYGLGLCGLQILCPLSPRICLCIYDNAIYKSNSSSDGNIIISSKKIIKEINKLSVLNSDNSLIFNNNSDENIINKLARHKKNVTIGKSEIIEFPDSSKGVQMFVPKSVYEKIKLNFFKINKQALKLSFPQKIVRPRAGDFLTSRHGEENSRLTKYENIYFTPQTNIYDIPL